jgi:hypothetical protein
VAAKLAVNENRQRVGQPPLEDLKKNGARVVAAD